MTVTNLTTTLSAKTLDNLEEMDKFNDGGR